MRARTRAEVREAAAPFIDKQACMRRLADALAGEREYPADVMQLLYIANRYEKRAQIEAIDHVAKKHGIFFQKADEQGASEYQMDHSRIVLLFGAKGEPLSGPWHADPSTMAVRISLPHPEG